MSTLAGTEARGFVGSAHCCMSEPPLQGAGLTACQILKVCKANEDVDDCDRNPYAGCDHFDRNPGHHGDSRAAFEAGLSCLRNREAGIRSALVAGDCARALQLLGEAMHSVQDLALHSNLCEFDLFTDAERDAVVGIIRGDGGELPPGFQLKCWDPLGPGQSVGACGNGCVGDPYPHSNNPWDPAHRYGDNPCATGLSERMSRQWLQHLVQSLGPLWDRLGQGNCAGCDTPLGNLLPPNRPVTSCGGKPVEPLTSHDPNEKTGPSGVDTLRFIARDDVALYEIAFENSATASAPAQRVEVVDLPSEATLDAGTAKLVALTIGDTVVTLAEPSPSGTLDCDLRPARNVVVRATWWHPPGQPQYHVVLQALDPATLAPPEDPLGGFLPPNLTPPEGDGSVLLSFTQRAGLADGARLENRAEIKFDANEVIPTNTWANTFDGASPVSVVDTLPSISARVVPVRWRGEDPGSGIAEYTIYVADGGSAPVVWLDHTRMTSAGFVGTHGHHYAFFARSRDRVGNQEPMHALPDAFTVVDTTVAVTGITGTAEASWDSCVVTWYASRFVGDVRILRDIGAGWVVVGGSHFDGAGSLRWVDTSVPPGRLVRYALQDPQEPDSASAIVEVRIPEGPSFGIRDVLGSPGRTPLLRYGVDRAGEISVSVFDILGRRVRSIVVSHARPGVYGLPVTDDRLGPGIYLVVLKQGNRRDVRRAVLVR